MLAKDTRLLDQGGVKYIDFLCPNSILTTSIFHSPKVATSIALAISFGFYLHRYKKYIISNILHVMYLCLQACKYVYAGTWAHEYAYAYGGW